MKLLKKIVRFAKKNPEVALAIAGAVAPGIVAKVVKKAGPIIAAVDKD